jgi:hypothetical protein
MTIVLSVRTNTLFAERYADHNARPAALYVEKPCSVRCKKMQLTPFDPSQRSVPKAQYFRHFLRISA